MAGIQARLERAAAHHRRAVALAVAADEAIARQPLPRQRAAERAIRELAGQLRATAAGLAPGWLGVPLDTVPADTPLGTAERVGPVRLGTAYPLDLRTAYPVPAGTAYPPVDLGTAYPPADLGPACPSGEVSFPVVVPLGHLAFASDARDDRVAAALRAVLLRLLASCRAGSVLVRPVDPTGEVFAPFRPLRDAGLMAEPVRDRAGLHAVLDEAERWRQVGRPRRSLLLVVAAWPRQTTPAELARVAALAASPPDGLHLVIAGWPPAVARAPAPGPLPHATTVTLAGPYALVGDPSADRSAATAVPEQPTLPGLEALFPLAPPGGTAPQATPPGDAAPQPASPGGAVPPPVPPGGASALSGSDVPTPGTSGLPAFSAPVHLDPAPPDPLVTRVCTALADQATDRARLDLGELLPQGPLWTESAAGGLAVVIGRRAGDAPVTVRLTDATPHWMIVGQPGSGKTALLLAVVYGLCSRYGPDQLSIHLLDPGGGQAFAELAPQPSDPSCLPHVRTVGVADRPGAVAVLRSLVDRLHEVPDRSRRHLCVIDDLDALLGGDDPVAQEATRLLERLARYGGRAGIHLVLAGCAPAPAKVAAGCRVRIALPGGGAALDPANQAAAALALGTAVVNTASGLGGPVGATRAHEQLIRFPDPYADRAALAGLRHRLWRQSLPAGGLW